MLAVRAGSAGIDSGCVAGGCLLVHVHMNAILEQAAKRKVRAVVRTESPAAEAVFNIAAQGKIDWTPFEWARLLSELDVCEDTVAVFVEKRSWL